MKRLPPALFAFVVIASLLAPAASTHGADGKKKAPRDSAAPPAAESNDDYPLKTCVVSGEPLNAGEFITYTHRESGKPDRVVRLCCEGCIEDFRQNPEKFLKKIDAARPKPKG